ncbi:MAG TPA: phosphotransferase [Steroidobacteraceae bacterium]|nr:phosphotransferase [Steroidobacteraceae bacterium]
MSVARTLDAAALERYFASALPSVGRVSTVRQFDGGQSNPTYLIEASSGRYVLRRKPPGALLPSAHAVDREFRVIRALRDTQVPVPDALCFCDDESVIGTVFYVMEYVPGEIYRDPDLPQLTPTQRTKIYDELNRVIAALHSIDPAAVGLEDFGRAGNYAERQIARWTQQYRASETEKIDAMERLIDWLPAHIPSDEEEQTRIIHGDYRIGNVIFDRETLALRAVLDWELSTLGNPLADFAYHCMPYRLPASMSGCAGAGAISRPGIPSEAEYLRRYCERTGRAAIRSFDFYCAFGMFRLAAILQGVKARSLQGNAASTDAFEAGNRARPMAEAGWAQVMRAHH